MTLHATQSPILSQDRLFVGGQLVAPESEDVIEVVSPVTEEPIATAPSSTPGDIDRAVRAARIAFDEGPWPRLSPTERADALEPFGEYLRARIPEIAALITEEMGSPISFSNQLQAPIPVMLLDYYRQLAVSFPFEEERAGVSGPARILREALVRHPLVDKISFTGSSATGRRVAALCGERFKRVTLECGGKSAAIILEDADIDSVVPALMPFAIMMSGQHCLAQTRLLAPKSRYREIVDAISQAAAELVVGDPHDPATEVGPLVAERQRRRVEDYIDGGRKEGARITV